MHNEAEASIQTGSKSFALAGYFFPVKEWDAATKIYHWCRYCDDVIDEGGSKNSLNFLRSETHKVLNENLKSEYVPFNSLGEVVHTYNIPFHYPQELLSGMEMDIVQTKYNTITELELYCYRVASVVGLMMCYVMGIFRVGALKNAAHLGMAMQLTNICRDVKEDHRNGRVYLPAEMLREHEISENDIFADRTKLFQVVRSLLHRAENYYQSGFDGVNDLPIRSAFVITMAALFYREIGRKILREGEGYFDHRSIVGKPRKVTLIFLALLMTIKSFPKRLLSKKEKVVINQIWTPA